MKYIYFQNKNIVVYLYICLEKEDTDIEKSFVRYNKTIHPI